MISMLFCVLCIIMFYKMMGVVLKASWGIFKIGLYIIAAPLIFGAFIVSGFAVMMVMMFIIACLVCLLGLL